MTEIGLFCRRSQAQKAKHPLISPIAANTYHKIARMYATGLLSLSSIRCRFPTRVEPSFGSLIWVGIATVDELPTTSGSLLCRVHSSISITVSPLQGGDRAPSSG